MAVAVVEVEEDDIVGWTIGALLFELIVTTAALSYKTRYGLGYGRGILCCVCTEGSSWTGSSTQLKTMLCSYVFDDEVSI